MKRTTPRYSLFYRTEWFCDNCKKLVAVKKIWREKSRRSETEMHFCEGCYSEVLGEYYLYLDNDVLPDDQPMDFQSWFNYEYKNKNST